MTTKNRVGPKKKTPKELAKFHYPLCVIYCVFGISLDDSCEKRCPKKIQDTEEQEPKKKKSKRTGNKIGETVDIYINPLPMPYTSYKARGGDS